MTSSEAGNRLRRRPPARPPRRVTRAGRRLLPIETVAGLASARARGRKGGRPYKMTPAKLRLAAASMSQSDTRSPTSAQNSESPARPSTATSRPTGSSGPTAVASWRQGSRVGKRRIRCPIEADPRAGRERPALAKSVRTRPLGDQGEADRLFCVLSLASRKFPTGQYPALFIGSPVVVAQPIPPRVGRAPPTSTADGLNPVQDSVRDVVNSEQGLFIVVRVTPCQGLDSVIRYFGMTVPELILRLNPHFD